VLILFIVLAALIVVMLAVLIAIPIIILPNFLGRRFPSKHRDSRDYGILSEQITLTTDDGLNLAAWCTKSNVEAAKGTIVVLTGLMNPPVTYYFGCAKMFADHGWDTLLIEMRARGLSEGNTIGLGLTEWRDVKAGIDFLIKNGNKNAPIVVMGTSMGGGTVITAAGEIPCIDGVIAISAFTSFANMAVELLPSYRVPRFIARLSLPFLNLFIGFRLRFDVLKYKPIKAISKLGARPILLMHSTEDREVPFSQYEILLAKSQAEGVNVTTFVREGDEHFVLFAKHLQNPTKDVEFCDAVLGFLDKVDRT